MSKRKTEAFRVVRKSAHIGRRVLTKGANLSAKVERKADSIIHGTDPTVQIHDKVLFEKFYNEAIPEITPIHPSLPTANRPATVTLLIPSLQKSSFFGGTATALIIAGKLAVDMGYPLRIVETLTHGNAKLSELVSFFHSHDIGLNDGVINLVDLSPRTYNNYGYLDIHPSDIFIASAWWDAYLLDRLPLIKPYIYLIQDYEPIFYNNSDKFVLAESTYCSEKFIPVCNTELMKMFMAKKGYGHVAKNALYFEPAVNIGKRYGYYDTPKGQKRRLFLYGRPSVDRNLFQFALLCLDELFSHQELSSNEWDLYMAGQDKVADIVLSSGATVHNLGKMSLDDYYAFMRTVDVAFSPMLAPHPNYPTLEFASSGSAVVTTSYETKQDLALYSKNIFIGPADKEIMKELILKAADVSAQKRVENAKASNISGDWHAALENTVNSLKKKFS